MGRRWMRRAAALIMCLGLLGLVALPTVSQANDFTYYPETGHFLGGGFRDFWNNHGGLYVFGYPITEEYNAANGRRTQYFERARFEWFPENTGTPYEVQLGLMGTESTYERVFPQTPPRANDANHRFFPETSHVMMWGFKTIWESKGGLTIFGLPISEEMMEILPADNKWHIVQYFERARFEYWPNFAPGERVLVSDLGRRLAPRELMPPLPPDATPGSPPPGSQPPGIPDNINATVDPRSGPVGTVFRFNAFGFQPGEEIALWATAPDQSVIPADFSIIADGDGSITSSEIVFNALDGVPTGVWAVTFQGNGSGHAAVAFFEVQGNAGPPPPPPPAEPLPPDLNASVQPREAPAGSVFYYFAHGFLPYETVYVALVDQYGNVISDVLYGPADGNGSIDYASIRVTTPANFPPDIYAIYSISDSNREAYAFFRVTSPNTNSLLAGNPAVLYGTSGQLEFTGSEMQNYDGNPFKSPPDPFGR